MELPIPEPSPAAVSQIWVLNTYLGYETSDGLYPGSLTEINATNGSFIRTVIGPQYGFDAPEGLALDGTHIWVSNNANNTITEIDQSSGALIKILRQLLRIRSARPNWHSGFQGLGREQEIGD